jgi:hypothetical protein
VLEASHAKQKQDLGEKLAIFFGFFWLGDLFTAKNVKMTEMRHQTNDGVALPSSSCMMADEMLLCGKANRAYNERNRCGLLHACWPGTNEMNCFMCHLSIDFSIFLLRNLV